MVSSKSHSSLLRSVMMVSTSLQDDYTQNKDKFQPWQSCYRLYQFKYGDSNYICHKDYDCNKCGNKSHCQKVQALGCPNCKPSLDNQCPIPFPVGFTPLAPNKLVTPSVNVLQGAKGISGLKTLSGIVFDFQQYRNKLENENIVLQGIL